MQQEEIPKKESRTCRARVDTADNKALKESLLLETGWYRPETRRVPVTKAVTFCLQRSNL
jgi:hypothetical protein